MGLQCGLLGLPNVGKSTVFNALLGTQAAQAANYPFCTIEPNVGRVAVADERLSHLGDIAHSQTLIPHFLDIVDIAGLIRGASRGEGQGNQFLSAVRNVDALLHVVRCFEDQDIAHVDGSVDPCRDVETIMAELILADLAVLDTWRATMGKKAKGGDKESLFAVKVADKVWAHLEGGQPLRTLVLHKEEKACLHHLQLLTEKPLVYLCNVDEESAATGNTLSASLGDESVVLSAAVESEIAQLPPGEKGEFLEALGLQESGLDRVIRAGFRALNLLTFFTAGPKESRAWTLPVGSKAPQAAGVIHSDFEKGFIRAETISYEDYVAYGGEQGARAHGRVRMEGKEYEVCEGDVLHFHFTNR